MSATGLASALADAIDRGDEARTVELVLGLGEKERRAIRPHVAEQYLRRRRHGGRHEPRTRAATLAWLGTATGRQSSGDFWHVAHVFDLQADADLELVYGVLAARGRSHVETAARGWVSEGRQEQWPLVRRAVRDGLIEPPDPDAYVRGMVHGVGGWQDMADADGIYHGLVADPALLEDEVWRIFDVDCGTELSNAATWLRREGAHAWDRGENRWHRALERLAAEERLDRARLLDESLAALMRDFRPSMVDWYAKLHEALAPTPAEREARVEQYLGLLNSPVPAVVKEGILALRAVGATVPPASLARAAVGPLTQRQKNLAVDMLRLLARAAEREHEGRPELLEAVAAALGHERSDVQERALSLLEAYPEDAPRAALLGVADAVSPTLRARVDALTGLESDTAETPPAQEAGDLATRLARVPSEARRAAGADDALSAVAAGRWPSPAYPVMTPDLLGRVGTPLAPVASVDELIELAAMLLESQGSGDDVERFLDGVSRLCGERPRGLERRAAGLLKQVGEPRHSTGFVAQGWDLVAGVVGAWIARKRPRRSATAELTVIGFLGQRATEVAARARRGQARPLLAMPTHAGGWIDPEVLRHREARSGRIFNRPDAADVSQAHVRAFPDVEPISFAADFVTRRRSWGGEERDVVMRPRGVSSALGPLVKAVGALEREPRQGEWWLYGSLWGGWDALGTRWSATVLPSLPEVAFAGAVPALVRSLEGATDGQPAAVLERALEPDLPLGATAWLAVAGSLVAKSPDLQRVGTDVLVASVSDGRFDPDGLATGLAWLVERKLAKVSRLEAPLRDAARVSPLHAAQVVRTVEAFVGRCTETPHGALTILEAALDGATRIGYGFETDRGRAALRRMSGQVSRSAKLGRVADGLLATRPTELAATSLRASAAATAVERAERYAAG